MNETYARCCRCKKLLDGDFIKDSHHYIFCKECYDKTFNEEYIRSLNDNEKIELCKYALKFSNSILENCCTLLRSLTHYQTTAEGVGYECIEKNNILLSALQTEQKG